MRLLPYILSSCVSQMRFCVHHRVVAQHARAYWDPEYVSGASSLCSADGLPCALSSTYLAILGARTCAVFQHNRFVVAFFLLLGLAVMGLSIVSWFALGGEDMAYCG